MSNYDCIVCCKENLQQRRKDKPEDYKRYSKDAYDSNPEKYRQASRDWASQNKEKVYETNKRYRENNSEQYKKRKKEHDRKYREKNKAKRNRQERYNRRVNPKIKVAEICRSLVHRVLKRSGKRKDARAHIMNGFTSIELRNHIESQFVDGMSWSNHGKWHIDHIRSIKSFLDAGITDPKIINALSNLQPLWATDNLRKGA